jgi:hypothetical protein
MLGVGKEGRIHTCWFFNCKVSFLSSSIVSHNRFKTVDKSSLLLFLIVHYVALWAIKPSLVQRFVCVCVWPCVCLVCVRVRMYVFQHIFVLLLCVRNEIGVFENFQILQGDTKKERYILHNYWCTLYFPDFAYLL